MRFVMHTAELNGGLGDTLGYKLGQMIHQLSTINQCLLAEIEARKLRQLDAGSSPGPPYSDAAATKEWRSRDRFAKDLRNSVLWPLLRAEIYLQLLESQIPPEQTVPGVNELKKLILHGIIQVKAIIWDPSPQILGRLPIRTDRESLMEESKTI